MGDAGPTMVRVVDKWDVPDEKYRLVEMTAGPMLLEHVVDGEWVQENVHYVHSALTWRIEQMKTDHAAVTKMFNSESAAKLKACEERDTAEEDLKWAKARVTELEAKLAEARGCEVCHRLETCARQMEAMLRKLEWSKRGPGDVNFCPRCGSSPGKGHHMTCDLSAVLVPPEEKS